MSQHTPGPWTVTGDEGRGMASVYGKGRKPGQHKQHVAEVWSGDDRDFQVSLANARLIAAAPDLLQALRDMLRYSEGTPDTSSKSAEVEDAARAAIAKAEGR